MQPKVKYRQPPLLFRNLGQRKFENASTAVGAQFSRPIVARGAAYGDYDRDGDLDVLFTENHGPAWLYRNDGGNANNFISIRTRGVKSNRDGIGAVVRVTSAGGTQWSMVRSGSSYCSQSDLALTFGLGEGYAGVGDRDRVAERAEGSDRQRPGEPAHHRRRRAKASSLAWRTLPPAGLFDQATDRQHAFLFPRAADDLNADREALG